MLNQNFNKSIFLSPMILLMLFSMININKLGAQTDSLSYTQESQQDSIIAYLSPMEYAFMMHEETNWLFKISFPVDPITYQFKIGVERRIAPSFTFNFDVDYFFLFEHNNEIFPMNALQITLEPRWYYRMNKRIRKEKVAKNMSDNYLAVGFGYYFGLDWVYQHKTWYAKWGVQRRFLKNGHIDFGAIASMRYYPESMEYFEPFFALNTFVDIGLAFTKDKYRLDHEKLCPVLKCYDADKYIFKSNLTNFLHLITTRTFAEIVIIPNVAFEHKISNSSFSINSELQYYFYYFIHFVTPERLWSKETELKLSLEGRWYYNLKHKILKGKTGNSFSANYVALGGSYAIHRADDYWNPVKKNNYSCVHLITGWQQLISKHLYFDFNVGVEYQFETEHEGDDIKPKFMLAVGYRF